MDSWSEDIDDSGFPEEFDDESLDETSNEEDKLSSCKSGSDRLFKVERHSHGSSTDLSVITRSDRSKSYSRLSHNENVTSAESECHLLDLLSDSGFPMTQVNGQRKLGPPPGWSKPPPDPSCEVFVGKIPRNLYEHEIYPIFKKMGDVYEIRLMMDFSGTNRGYCFVMFTKVEYAKRAIKELNNFAIRPGRKIGVVASINNCRLSIGQLPTDIDPEIVIKKFYEMTDDVSKVAVYKYLNGQVCCALVSYKTHRAAAMARRRLLPERGGLFPNVEVSVDWAPPTKSFHNVVEINGERDATGILQIIQSTINSYSKRRGSQRRNSDDFLDKSIKNYLQEKSAAQIANQRKFSGRGSSFPPRRKGYRANQAKLLDPESRGRECIKEIASVNRSRSLPIAVNENYIVGSDSLRYPKNRDVNGNITSFQNSQGFPTGPVNFCNEGSSDSSKIPNPSVSGGKNGESVARGPIKLLTNKGGLDRPMSFNLFEHYALVAANKSENASVEKSCGGLSGAAIWGGSVPNVFGNLETRSDGDLRTPQEDQLKFADAKCANFAEFGKWNSTESFVPRVDISEKMKDDSSKGYRNQRRNFTPCPKSGIPPQQKIMPNFRVLSPLTNWNENYNPNQVTRRFEAFNDNRTNSSTKGNVDYYAPQQPSPAKNCPQNRVGNYCRGCVEQSGITQRQIYSPGEISALYHQQQAPYAPHHDWRVFNEAFENQEPSDEAERVPRGPYFPPQSLFSTSTFADYYRFVPQIYPGNSQMPWRPRPILNRRTATVGDNN